MKTHNSNLKRCLATLVGLGLFMVCDSHAQQPQRNVMPGGGFNRNAAQNTGNAGASQYNANGAVGNATISIDADSHNVTIIADEETTKYISQVITNLDRPQPQVLIKVVFVQVTHSDASDIGVEGGWMKGIATNITGFGVNSFGLSALASAAGSNAPALNAFGQPIQSFQQIAPFAAGVGAGMYQILGSDFQATLRAIAAAGKAEVLSRPSILARNNQPAIRRSRAVCAVDHQRQLQHDLRRANQLCDLHGRGNHPDRDALHHQRRPGANDHRPAKLVH